MNSEGRKTVVIGVPCYSGVPPEILEDWMRFAFHCGRRMPEYDFLLAIRPKSEQFRARNAIVDAAMVMNADFLLMLDDDMIINTEKDVNVSSSYDFLSRLLTHNKDVVGGLYFQREGECSPVAMMSVGDKGYRFLRSDELKNGLQQVDVAGGGCMLVNMRVFDRIHRPYFEPEFEFSTDIQLCRKAKDKGFEIYLDSSVELGHIRNERTVVTNRNRSQFMGDVLPGETRKFIASEVFDRLVLDAEEYTGVNQKEFAELGSAFMRAKAEFTGSDYEWYKEYPTSRVVRQVWFNHTSNKRTMTEFILSSVTSQKDKPSILDFGCGIGIPAFTLAERGHNVTAMDLDGTGTINFLEWRAKKHGVKIDINRYDGNLFFTGKQFDVIIAMDCLEHIAGWRGTLQILAQMLKPGGVLFANNAILEDDTHPEHYHIDNAEFVSQCVKNGLLPINQIAYTRKA